VQSDKYVKIVETIIDTYIHIAPELADAKDLEGRPAVNLASPLCRRAIKQSTYFFRRYIHTYIHT
jgi:hypothetical protein